MSTQATQELVVGVLADVFGRSNMVDRGERSKRFLEEAVELARTAGLTNEEILAVVTYELGRPVGPDLSQEIGGAGVTLYAMAEAFGQNLEACVQKEIRRVGENAERCRAKHLAKPASVISSP